MFNGSPAQQKCDETLERLKVALREYEEEGNLFAKSVTIRRFGNGNLMDFVINFTSDKESLKDQISKKK
ncbi:MAG: hypothetical protein KG003_08075 [Bacteroidetes bacterium]|nr:hypothetical protein [Bacteroidota bacterium]